MLEMQAMIKHHIVKNSIQLLFDKRSLDSVILLKLQLI